MGLKPVPQRSQENRRRELSIKQRIEEVESGNGTVEVIFCGDGRIRLGLTLLHWYNYYIAKNEYPPPILLRYFGAVFSRILEGESYEKAFGVARSQGRPRIEENLEHSTDLGLAALRVWQLVNSKNEKVKSATAVVADELGLESKTVERAYYKNKAEFDAFIPNC